MKQIKHLRTYRKGLKKGHKYPAGSRKHKSFFAFKPVESRWFIANDYNKPQPHWWTRNPKDKNMTYYELVEWRGYKSSPFGDADKDGVPNVWDRAPLNPGIRKITPPGVKRGNLKLLKVIGIFNLPRYKTCPGKTKLCSRYCYAEPPEKFRGQVVLSRNRNYAWTRLPEFTRIVSEMINNMGFKWFRIHESGDFYNQEYLNKWVKIAENNPQTKFLAYTKNWNLDFSKTPPNMTIRYSCDPSSEHIREDLPICYVGVNQPKNFSLCKKRCAPGYCMACWDKKLDVHIPIHSISKANVDEMFFKQFNPTIPTTLLNRDRKMVKALKAPLLIEVNR